MSDLLRANTYRSSVLRVMSPARFRCATTTNNQQGKWCVILECLPLLDCKFSPLYDIYGISPNRSPTGLQNPAIAYCNIQYNGPISQLQSELHPSSHLCKLATLHRILRHPFLVPRLPTINLQQTLVLSEVPFYELAASCFLVDPTDRYFKNMGI
jgi:hypothetical protein